LSPEHPAPNLQRLLDRLKPELMLRQGADIAAFFARAKKARTRVLDLPVSSASDHAAICFTSGTTEGAKAVAHSFESYYHNAVQTVTRWGLAPGDRLLDYRSFSWAATHTVGLHPLLIGGHALAFAREFRAQDLPGW